MSFPALFLSPKAGDKIRRAGKTKLIGLKKQNQSDWKDEICRIEKTKLIGLKLQNQSDWNIIKLKILEIIVNRIRYKKYEVRYE